MIRREVVFLGAYGQISDPYAGFAIWEIKNPLVFVYFTSTYAIGVSVSSMWWPKTHGFLHTLALQLDRGIRFCNAIAKNQCVFAYFALPCLLPKADFGFRPKNGSRAILLNRSGNCFRPGLRNGSKRASGDSKNDIFGSHRKMVRAPYFWAVLAMVLGQEPEMLQNGLLEVPKTRYSDQTEK